MSFIRNLAIAMFCGVWLISASPAGAQTPGSGPLVLEPIGNGFVVAPDVKVTSMNGRIETLVGGYAAHVSDSHLLIGGAGYGLVTGDHGRGLGYGGLITGWIFYPKSTISLTAKDLLGFGWLSQPYTAVPPHYDHNHVVVPVGPAYYAGQQFFIFEPELDVHVKISHLVAITAGGSYRLVNLYHPYNGYYYYYGSGNFEHGPSGNISVQFRFGK